MRADDSPEVLHRRLVAYRQQTAPLIVYYRQRGVLHSVDGMAPIGDVGVQIESALAGAPAAIAETAQQPRLGKKSKKVRVAAPRKPARVAPKRSAPKAKHLARSKPKAKAKSKAKPKMKAKARTKAKGRTGTKPGKRRR